MSRRTERVASTLQQELALILQREIHDPRLEGIVSITRVNVSPDLSQADVYIAAMGSSGEQTAALHALRHSAGMMRTRLTKVLSLRVAPFLKFHVDENLKKELAMMDLLDKVARENAELDRRRASAQAAEPDSAPTASSETNNTASTEAN